MNIEKLDQLKRNEGVTMRKLDSTYYFISKQGTYEVNEIGATIVNALGRDLSINELCRKISEKYSFDDLNQIRHDVNNYIEFLLSEGILISE